MRKILTLIIACLMITTLVACGNEKEPTPPTIEQENTEKDFLEDEMQISKQENDIDTQTILTIDVNNPNLSFFTIYGKAELLSEPISYDGIYASNKLLISEKTSISFKTTKKMTLVVHTVDSNSKKINIDEKDYVIEDNKVSIDIEAGDHIILPSESFITCIFVNEFSTRINLNLSPDHSIGFDSAEVEISQKDGKTTYTFTETNAVIEKLDNEEYATIINAGTDNFLKEVLENLSNSIIETEPETEIIEEDMPIFTDDSETVSEEINLGE